VAVVWHPLFATGTCRHCPTSPAFPPVTIEKEDDMPLFFIIAIGAGAFTLGATTVDVTSDMRHQERTAQVQTTSQQATVYATMDDCVRAMAQQNLPASNCQQR
jgi:hypothetical protein